MCINCIECGDEIEEIHDTTHSNINTHRCSAGDHTGNIYICEKCDILLIDDFLTGTVHYWNY
jgi:hypothetical protein